MRNPLRSEGDAFRFVLLTIGYFALIVIGSLIDSWVGLAVFLVLTALALWAVFRRREPEPPVPQAPAPSPPDERRILVVANETVGGAPLLDKLKELAFSSEDTAKVHVVSPALNSPLRHLASDEDPARAAAQERLERSLGKLKEEGIEASGEVGDGDPLQAIEDALVAFDADELIVATHPPERSNWLEHDLVERACARFGLPVLHVVVDVARSAERLAA